MKNMTLTEARETAQLINEIIERVEECGGNVLAVDANGIGGPARCYVIHDTDRITLEIFHYPYKIPEGM